MKSIIVLLIVLALTGGFVLFMRNQDIKKELQAKKDAMELEARQREEERAREARQREEERAREARQREEERARETRQREEAREAAIKRMQGRISSLKQELAAIQNPDAAPPEAKRIYDEIAEIDRMLNDETYKCFDFCITFGNVEFLRVMHHDREEPNSHGYYIGYPSYYFYYDGRKRKKGWRKVPVSYHCNRHNITWTGEMADSYKRTFTPKNRLESKRRLLEAELKRVMHGWESRRTTEIARIKAAISAAEQELAEFQRTHADTR